MIQQIRKWSFFSARLLCGGLLLIAGAGMLFGKRGDMDHYLLFAILATVGDDYVDRAEAKA